MFISLTMSFKPWSNPVMQCKGWIAPGRVWLKKERKKSCPLWIALQNQYNVVIEICMQSWFINVDWIPDMHKASWRYLPRIGSFIMKVTVQIGEVDICIVETGISGSSYPRAPKYKACYLNLNLIPTWWHSDFAWTPKIACLHREYTLTNEYRSPFPATPTFSF